MRKSDLFRRILELFCQITHVTRKFHILIYKLLWLPELPVASPPWTPMVILFIMSKVWIFFEKRWMIWLSATCRPVYTKWERFTQKQVFTWFWHAENEVFVLTSCYMFYRIEIWDIVPFFGKKVNMFISGYMVPIRRILFFSAAKLVMYCQQPEQVRAIPF